MPTLEDALHKLQRGQLKEGRQILEKLLQQEPSNPRLLYNLGICYSEQNHVGKSIQLLKRCIAADPNYVNAYAALGFSYQKAGQTQKAIETLEQGLAKDPKNFHVLKNLGSLYGNEGQLDKAIECLETADEITPGAPDVLYGLAFVYEQKEMIDSAELMYKRIIDDGHSSQFVDLAEQALTRIGMQTLQATGPRSDAVIYCLSALEKFAQMGIEEVQKIAYEIAVIGQNGLDINNPRKTYTINSLPGEFTGLQLLCYMYTGFQMIDPSIDIGADLSLEYSTALKMFEKGEQ